MNILACPDSFKGSLSASEAAKIIKKAFCDTIPGVSVTLCPLADGGEGTVDAFLNALGGERVDVAVHDPLMRKINACYALCGKTAVIETAAASGITLLSESELSPLVTTTYGTGELLLHALGQNIDHLIIGLGGSATNDGGTGLLRALGVKFLDVNGCELPYGGGALKNLAQIDISGLDGRLAKVKITAACDVKSPLCGENGASRVFARQKGASDAEIDILEECLANLARITKTALGKDFALKSGAGAAGGLGFALSAFAGAELTPCFDLLCAALDLDGKIQNCDIVITGEGKTDASSLLGKLPIGISNKAKQHGKKCFLTSGDITCPDDVLYKAFDYAVKSRIPGESVEESMKNAPERLYCAACDAARAAKDMIL